MTSLTAFYYTKGIHTPTGNSKSDEREARGAFKLEISKLKVFFENVF